MEKLDPKIDGASKDIVAENVAKLRELFPEVFTEGKIDFDVLKEVLGEYVEHREERYSFTWHGKSQARRIAQTPSTGTLRPVPEESVNWDTTQNLFIEGDNLEVLKLMQKSYHKKIKMIYIDPPYNTGKEFIYSDNFSDNLTTYLRYSGQMDDNGLKLSTNLETSGRYHTNWLNMMYPRLRLARNLLRDDGLIFISIDDHEVANLRKMCDEIFGEENFVTTIIWEKRYTRSNNAKLFASMTEYLLCYRKSPEVEILREPRDEKADSIYSNPDNDPRGPWTSVSYVNPATKAQRPNLVYPIRNPFTGQLVEHPTNAWKYERSVHEMHVRENRLYWGKNGENKYPRLKLFLSEMDKGMVPVNLWRRQQTGTTDEGSKQLEELMGGKVFDFPKPHTLIQRAIRIATGPNDLILDFFAGSAPTAQAVLEQNFLDGGKRRFILVQLPEPCDADSESRRMGYSTVAEIAKERIRRVIRKLEQRYEERAHARGHDIKEVGPHASTPDLGFKVFKLDSSNIKAWDPDSVALENALIDAVESIRPGRSELDVLYELLLKQGIDLAVPIEERQIEGRHVYIVGGGALVVCLSDDIDMSVADGIAALKAELEPEIMHVIFKDSGFRDDVVKTNTVQILKRAGVDRVVSV